MALYYELDREVDEEQVERAKAVLEGLGFEDFGTVRVGKRTFNRGHSFVVVGGIRVQFSFDYREFQDDEKVCRIFSGLREIFRPSGLSADFPGEARTYGERYGLGDLPVREVDR
jgi:hypothetical protein